MNIPEIRLAGIIKGPTTDDCLRNIDKFRKLVYSKSKNIDYVKVIPMIEARYDLAKEFDIEKVAKHSDLESIFTIRHEGEGGEFRGSEEERRDLKQQAIDAGYTMIDNEIEYPLELDLKGAKEIKSRHNFNFTPEDIFGMYILDRSRFPDATIKYAMMANSHSDSIRMLETIDKADNFIGIGMGEVGRITRSYGLNLGSYLTFVALNKKEASAPGQFSVGDIVNHIEQYKGNLIII